MKENAIRIREENGKPVRSGNHLPFLDGIRGFAALYVVVFHIVQNSSLANYAFFFPLQMGHYAVTIFIVLSGFSLMLPVVRGRDIVSQSDFREYILRRSKRVLLPYYSAYLLALVLFIAGRVVRGQDYVIPAGPYTSSGLAWDNVLSYLTLCHHLLPRWTFASVNTALWSVGVEWQIYFLFPLVLLPLWRSYSAYSAIGFGLIVGVCIGSVFPQYMFVSPWYIGIFAVGMLGAQTVYNRTEIPSKADSVLFSSLSVVTLIVFVSAFLHFGVRVKFGIIDFEPRWLIDILVSFGAITAIIALGIPQKNRLTDGVCRILESRIATALGAFSYSLYLTHYIIIKTVLLMFRETEAKGSIYLQCSIAFITLFISLIFAYVFYLFVERRTVVRREALDRKRIQ